MLTRAEFIGMQNGETVSGHKFVASWDEMRAWLKEEKVSPYIIGLAGMVPDPLLLDFGIVDLLVDDPDYPTDKEINLIHALNKLVEKYIDYED